MLGRARSNRRLDVMLAGVVAALAALIILAAVPGPNHDHALARDPLDLSSLRGLGLALERTGQSDQAEAVMRFVGARTWRDGPTQVWLLRRRLDQGRYQDAFRSADALLRRDAEETTRPVLFPLLVAAAAYDDARPALVARLAAAPWWRGDFLRTLAVHGRVLGTASVFTELANTATPPTPAEYAPFVDRLVGEGDYAGAFAVWRRVVRARGVPDQGLRDGDFTGRFDGAPFTWSVAAGAGGESETGPAPDGAPGWALRVTYDGFSSPSLPTQLLVLSPGIYRVSWRQRIAPPSPERLFWRIRCADSGLTAARAPVEGRTATNTRWRDMAMAVVIPASGCAGQWLELATAAGERRRPVEAWFAGFRLRSAS